MHELVNNGARVDTVAEDSNFRSLTDHSINNRQNLKGFYQHMSWWGCMTIEEDKFNNLMKKSLISSMRFVSGTQKEQENV